SCNKAAQCHAYCEACVRSKGKTGASGEKPDKSYSVAFKAFKDSDAGKAVRASPGMSLADTQRQVFLETNPVYLLVRNFDHLATHQNEIKMHVCRGPGSA